MERPQFENIKSYNEFIKYYWYLEELQAICKKLHLEYVSGKIKLNNVIKSYFDGVIIPHKPKVAIKCKAETLPLETSLINCVFTFGQWFRDFYIQATGDKNFKFTVDMLTTAKSVNTKYTLGDLLDIRLGKKVYAIHEKSSCQWNKFLKDFCADKMNNTYPNKFETARRFWEILWNSDLPKAYSTEFIVDKNKI
ncbi:MAG: SAP domain-containing protein [Anaeroplasmataceae bacterium]|nr:SAP domain-containing protein [Anaeroplasmataceae bacterium]